MNIPSPKSAGFMSNLRSGYASGGGLNFGAVKAPVSTPASAVAPTPVVAPALTDDEQLALAEQVIGEIEASKKAEVSKKVAVEAPVESPAPVAAEAPAQPPIQPPVQSPTDPLGGVAQALPQTVASFPDPLNPANPTPVGSLKKEAYVVGSALDALPAAAPEYPGGVTAAEVEKTPEISPEVESFLEHATNQPDNLPQEIVVADNQAVSSVTHYPKQPVIVLPITAKIKEEGKKKGYQFSVRWLVEWSLKIIKKFSGKVIYLEEK